MCEVTVKFEQHLSHHSCQHLTDFDIIWKHLTSLVTFDKFWPHWWARPSLTISITYPFGQHGIVLIVFAIWQIHPNARKEASRRCRPRHQRRSRQPRRQPSRLRCRRFLNKILILCDSHSEPWGDVTRSDYYRQTLKIRRARSGLYRSRIFQVDASFSVFF